jgi:hypothetical protein
MKRIFKVFMVILFRILANLKPWAYNKVHKNLKFKRSAKMAVGSMELPKW